MLSGKRILILGCSGSGKSTLATNLAARSKLPAFYIDQLIWQPNWIMCETPELERNIAGLLKRKAWVVDGMLGRHTAKAVSEATTVIFLDFPRWLCLKSVLWRVIRSYGKARPEMHPGCPEKFDWEFLVWIWRWNKRNRPVVMDALQKLGPKQTLIHLKSRGELRRWLEETGLAYDLNYR